MAKHSFYTLMRRLSRAGFKRKFVYTALMPDWWEESYARDPSVLPEVEIRVARFLNISLSEVRNAEVTLMPPSYKAAQLRRVRDISRDRLRPAIHTAIRVSEAVVRNFRGAGSVKTPLINDAFKWRQILTSGENAPVRLGDILSDLWAKGVLVIPLDTLPTPSFQGLACIVDGQPVVVLGQKYDEPGRVAFLVAHEAGHITAGDCSPGVPVVDEDEGVQDTSDMERVADGFATKLLLGEETVNIPDEGLDFRMLAQRAVDLESQTGADASSLMYAWAARTLNYADATMAVKALYRSVGARRQVRQLFDKYVDCDSATESDRDLLRCVYGEPLPTAVSG